MSIAEQVLTEIFGINIELIEKIETEQLNNELYFLFEELAQKGIAYNLTEKQQIRSNPDREIQNIVSKIMDDEINGRLRNILTYPLERTDIIRGTYEMLLDIQRITKTENAELDETAEKIRRKSGELLKQVYQYFKKTREYKELLKNIQEWKFKNDVNFKEYTETLKQQQKTDDETIKKAINEILNDDNINMVLQIMLKQDLFSYTPEKILREVDKIKEYDDLNTTALISQLKLQLFGIDIEKKLHEKGMRDHIMEKIEHLKQVVRERYQQ